MKKGILNNTKVLIFGALIACCLAFFIWRLSGTIVPLKTSDSSPVIVQEPVLIEDPYISSIRATLDNYLKDPKSVSETLVEGLGDEKSGLKNFSTDYYKSKFVLVNSKDSMAGGKEFNILFTDKADKVFWVWVYKLADGAYEMRGFQENPSFTADKIEKLMPFPK